MKVPKSVKSETSCASNPFSNEQFVPIEKWVSFLEVLCPVLPLLPQNSTHMISGTDMTIGKSNQPFAYTHWQNISEKNSKTLLSSLPYSPGNSPNRIIRSFPSNLNRNSGGLRDPSPVPTTGRASITMHNGFISLIGTPMNLNGKGMQK